MTVTIRKRTNRPAELTRPRPGTVGAAGVIEPAREFIVDVPTVAGAWPFALTNLDPQPGTPLGIDPNSGRLACYDPHTAFLNGLQRAAQLAILAANGVGKSLLAKKLATGLAGQGIATVVPFDAKNEYTSLVDAIDGTTLAVGRHGGLNAIDPGEIIAHATRTGAPDHVRTELAARRNQLLVTIAGISRGAPLTGWEQTALAAAAGVLDIGATLSDLATVFTTRTGHLAETLARPEDRATELLEPLALDIAALAGGSIGQALGTAGPHQRWSVDRSLVIDTSAILASEPELTAAVTVTCWTAALSAIYHHNATVADQVVAVIFDEIWRATREFPALANQIGGLLRMDRNDGIISILATHSWTDTAQQGGSNILARCAAFAIGGMQNEEIDTIAAAGLGLNNAELDEIRANAAAGTTIDGTAHGGIGRFLIKTGDHPGQLIQTILTPTERALYDTNNRWRPTTDEPASTEEHTTNQDTTNSADVDDARNGFGGDQVETGPVLPTPNDSTGRVWDTDYDLEIEPDWIEPGHVDADRGPSLTLDETEPVFEIDENEPADPLSALPIVEVSQWRRPQLHATDTGRPAALTTMRPGVSMSVLVSDDRQAGSSEASWDGLWRTIAAAITVQSLNLAAVSSGVMTDTVGLVSTFAVSAGSLTQIARTARRDNLWPTTNSTPYADKETRR